eukprot:c28225_g1_i2 orf=1023-1391(-)
MCRFLPAFAEISKEVASAGQGKRKSDCHMSGKVLAQGRADWGQLVRHPSEVQQSPGLNAFMNYFNYSSLLLLCCLTALVLVLPLILPPLPPPPCVLMFIPVGILIMLMVLAISPSAVPIVMA